MTIDSSTFALLLSFVITSGMVILLRPLALKIGLVDKPGGRKHHDGEIPLIGGIAIFCGFIFSVLMISMPLAPYRALFAGGALLIIIGILDDFHDLSTIGRFLFQIVAALIMCLQGGIVITDLGDLLGFGSLELGVFALPFTVFCVIGLINALNMIDGIDGLAGSIALIAFSLLAYLAYRSGNMHSAMLLLVLSVSTIAFLVFNLRIAGRKRASIFLGDAGSMFIGFAIVWFLIELSQSGSQSIRPVTALWIVSIPLIDTIAVMLRRITRGASPFDADHSHVHHILMHLSGSVSTTLFIIAAAAIVMAALGIIGEKLMVPEWLMFAAFTGISFAYLFLTKPVLRKMAPVSAN